MKSLIKDEQWAIILGCVYKFFFGTKSTPSFYSKRSKGYRLAYGNVNYYAKFSKVLSKYDIYLTKVI